MLRLDKQLCGDIILVKGDNIASNVIATHQYLTSALVGGNWRGNKYSHVMMSMGKGVLIHSVPKKGIGIININECNDIYKNKQNWKILRHSIVESSETLQEKINNRALYHLGKNYGIGMPKRFICTNFISCVFSEVSELFPYLELDQPRLKLIVGTRAFQDLLSTRYWKEIDNTIYRYEYTDSEIELINAFVSSINTKKTTNVLDAKINRYINYSKLKTISNYAEIIKNADTLESRLSLRSFYFKIYSLLLKYIEKLKEKQSTSWESELFNIETQEENEAKKLIISLFEQRHSDISNVVECMQSFIKLESSLFNKMNENDIYEDLDIIDMFLENKEFTYQKGFIKLYLKIKMMDNDFGKHAILKECLISILESEVVYSECIESLKNMYKNLSFILISEDKDEAVNLILEIYNIEKDITNSEI